MEAEALATEAQEAILTHKVSEEQHQRNALRENRSPCRAGDTPLKPEDEDRIENGIQQNGNQRDGHRLLGIARHTEHIIQAMEQMRYDISVEDDAHILARIGKSLLAGTKEEEQIVDIDQSEDHDNQAQHHVEQNHVTQDILRCSLIALTQADRGKRSRTCSDHSAKGRREVHHRHRKSQTSDGQRAYTLSHEDTIDNVVERCSNLRNDGRQRIAQQQFRYRIGS